MTDADRQLVLDVAATGNRMTRAAFFVGPCNAHALLEIDGWRNWDGLPRVLTGAATVGKTHLARIFARMTHALWLDADRLGDADPDRARPRKALVIDDAHRLAADPERQRLAFHLYTQARDARQPFLLAGRGEIRDWGLSLPDLESRLTASARISVANPDQDTLRMVLIKLFSDRQLAVPPETVEYALNRMERSFAAAHSLVAALDETSLLKRQRIDKSLVRAILSGNDPDTTEHGGPE